MKCVQASGAWCPQCYAGVRGRKAYRGHAQYRRSKRPYVEVLVKRREPVDGASHTSGSAPLVPASWGEKYPFLWEFLTVTRFEDGSPRQAGTLLLFVDQGVLKGCLSDREYGEVAFCSASDPDMLLMRLEDGLQLQCLEWRASAKGGKKSSRN